MQAYERYDFTLPSERLAASVKKGSKRKKSDVEDADKKVKRKKIKKSSAI